MKKLLMIAIALMMTLTMSAQRQDGQAPKFSPEKFDAELQQYIIQKAALTPQEAAKFFPVFKEMQTKQRAIYDRQRKLGQFKPSDEAGCMKAIQERDNLDVELRRVQQNYHNKFFDVLPATKVYDVLRAEETFFRHQLRQWSHGQKQKGKRQ